MIRFIPCQKPLTLLMSITVPQGFRLAGVHCGIKSDRAKNDLTLVVADSPCAAAGVYTTNLFFSPSVALNRAKTPFGGFRVLVANSGNANACTGDRGMQDAQRMARLAANACGAEESEALILSTGIIGEYLPMAKLESGIAAAAAALGDDGSAFDAASRGILTTDKSPKTASRSIKIGNQTIQVTAMAKGAGMIGPNMATMLAVVMTDAKLAPEVAQETLNAAVDRSFNCMSVDGHMSTSDTVLLLASGAAGGASLAGNALSVFQSALDEVCIELARMMADDGEGSSHLITIDVRGCRSREDARQIAKTIANSPLVKTGVAGADPNWGRIVSAAGYAGVPFDPNGLVLRLNGHLLFERGTPAAFDKRQVSESIHSQRETSIDVELAEGNEAVRFWTSDLTVDYVRFNADYHT